MTERVDRAAHLRIAVPDGLEGARVLDGAGADAGTALVEARIERARRDGIAEGERLERERAAALVEAACRRLDAAREELLAGASDMAIAIGLEIARQILHVELAAGRYGLERMVRETLAHSGVGRGACVVHLNPVDAAALAGVRFRAGTTIEADESVSRGDVHVTTPHGLLVREIDEALRSIGERLRAEAA